jgi:hypothetical protein
MKQAESRQLVLDVVRKVARGRPVASGTEFSRIGIGPWQRQRFFGPLRNAFRRRGIDIMGCGVTRESFTHYRTVREVQAAIWSNLRAGRPRPDFQRDSDSARPAPPFEWDRATMP